MNSSKGLDLGPSLIETLRTSDLSDILQDVGEIGLDTILDDDIVKDVPIIGTIVRIGRVATTIRDHLLLRKILIFLQGLSEVPQEQRDKILSRASSDKKYERRLGETIMLLLDRYDHFDKARVMSKLFNAYVREEIDLDGFLWLSTAVDRAFMKDLSLLFNYFSSNSLEVDTASLAQRLYGTGLSSTRVAASVDQEQGFFVASKEMWTQGSLLLFSLNHEAVMLSRAVLGDAFSHGAEDDPHLP